MTKPRGGARPKVREDDGRVNNGGARPGRKNAGRKPQRFTIKVDDAFAVWQTSPEGNPVGLGQLWKVKSMDRTTLVLVADDGYEYTIRR